MLSFPACRISYVRSICSRYGFEWDKDFATHVNRESRTIEVVRTR